MIIKALYKLSKAPYDLAMREIPIPTPKKGEVIISVHYSGICGTDIKILTGNYPGLETPLIPGHELSGKIHSLGSEVNDWKIGDNVVSRTIFSSCSKCLMCLNGNENLCDEKKRIGFDQPGAFAQYINVKASQLHKLPGEVNLKLAVLAEPLAVVVHAMRKINIKPEDKIMIIGPGPIGLIALLVAKKHCAEVTVVGLEKDKKRLELAEILGADSVVITDSKSERLLTDIYEMAAADFIFECTGSVEGLNFGLFCCKKQGTIVQVGTNNRYMEIDFMKVAYKELTIKGSIGHVEIDWEEVIHLLKELKGDLDTLISDIIPFEDWKTSIEKFKYNESIKIVFSFKPF